MYEFVEDLPLQKFTMPCHHSIMQVRETLGMDSPGTTFTQSSGYRLSKTTFFLICAIFICSLIAVGFLVYNFGVCPQSIVCEKHLVVPLPHEHHNKSSDGTSKTGHPTTDNGPIYLRLPRSLIPLNYSIRLIPQFTTGNFTFTGDIAIRLRIIEDCRNITLHALALTIKAEQVSVHLIHNKSQSTVYDSPKSKGPKVRIESQYYVESKQFYIIEVGKLLKANETYDLHMKFFGILNDYLQGFYRSSYMIGNQTRWIAATQFQPTDARRAFPCFDEPALKATFKLTIARPITMNTISNMPKIGKPVMVTGLEKYEWDEYEESVPMSTYLVAFAVTDFKNLTSGKFTVWARSDALESAKYALEMGPRLLNFFETFFDIKYPLPKMDMISLPDFTAGAMENWGLLTFKESTMLYDQRNSATVQKQRIAIIIAHELAHQWFGNLVTPDWWSDLWLNEGFASYMEYVGVNAVEPTWKAMDQFVLNEIQNVFTLDALSSSHRIWVEVGNPDEINEIFDKISYGKGAVIIRMMDNFLTTEVFKAGLRNFLNNKAYKAADQNDLWSELTLEAKKHLVFDNTTSVKEIMDTWTLQTGFPIVTVTRNYSTDDAPIDLHQERFVYMNETSISTTKSSLQSDGQNDPLWWIPITYTTRKDHNFTVSAPSTWMRQTRNDQMFVDGLSANDWLIVNVQQTGYYRVNYDINNWNLIIIHLRDHSKFIEIAPSNRAQLINDALNLACGGYLSYKTALDVTQYLKHETYFVPWKSAIDSLHFIDTMLINTPDYGKFKSYFLGLLQNVYKSVGFNAVNITNMLKIYKRIEILNVACHLGHSDCVSESRQIFHKWMMEADPNRHNAISPDLRSLVYCTAIKYGEQQHWDFAWDRYQSSGVASDRDNLLSALGCSREPWILHRFLKRAMTDKYGIRKHDVIKVFVSVSSNIIGQRVAFEFIRSHWKILNEYLGSSLATVHAIVKFATKQINNRYEIDELKKFISLNFKEPGRYIKQAVEQAESNIAWMDTNYQIIVDWLDYTLQNS